MQNVHKQKALTKENKSLPVNEPKGVSSFLTLYLTLFPSDSFSSAAITHFGICISECFSIRFENVAPTCIPIPLHKFYFVPPSVCITQMCIVLGIFPVFLASTECKHQFWKAASSFLVWSPLLWFTPVTFYLLMKKHNFLPWWHRNNLWIGSGIRFHFVCSSALHLKSQSSEAPLFHAPQYPRRLKLPPSADSIYIRVFPQKEP